MKNIYKCTYNNIMLFFCVHCQHRCCPPIHLRLIINNNYSIDVIIINFVIIIVITIFIMIIVIIISSYDQ